MKYKELREYRQLIIKIADLEMEIKDLSMLGSAPINDMPKGNSVSSPIEQFIIRKEKIQDKLNNYRLLAINNLDRIEKYINGIEDNELENIFREWFILGLKQKDIAVKHHMDRTTIYKKVINYLKRSEHEQS